MADEMIPCALSRYCEGHSSEEEKVLVDLNRRTHLEEVHPQMISGKLLGRLLTMISRMICPESILEIGTFTGYATYCLARGLNDNGTITTIEVNEELEDTNREFFKESGIADRVKQITGDALEIIPTFSSTFDLIFLDADKENYPVYLDLCRKALKTGGFLVADNTLWDGKVLNPSEHDKSARMLDTFNKQLHADPGFETVMLTIRDGLTIARKTSL